MSTRKRIASLIIVSAVLVAVVLLLASASVGSTAVTVEEKLPTLESTTVVTQPPTTTTTVEVPTSMTTTTTVPPKPKPAPKPAPEPAPAPVASSGSVWDALAGCETGGNWATHSVPGYSGGLGFADSSWVGFGGTAYAPQAWQASREAQIAVAERILASQGWRAWPACSIKLGLR